MALGGGTWLTQNKILPGSYINFVSASRASATLSDRGYAAMPLTMKWGVDGEVFSVTADEFQKDSLKIFGFPYTSDELKGLRDLFINIKEGHFYKLNTGGVKASCVMAEAKYTGSAGNGITLIVSPNEAYEDSNKLYDVTVMFSGIKVFEQLAVSEMNALDSNDWVDWKSGAAIALTAGTPFTGGTDGTVQDASYQVFLDKIESYSFNTLGLVSDNATIKGLFANFTKRMRDSQGVKFQCVLYRYPDADHEGIISSDNEIKGTDGTEIVYWVTGAEAGCQVNRSVTNKAYDGEYDIVVDHTQKQLENGLKAGKFMFHRVGDKVRVLEDINTFISFTDDKNDDFSSNQTIRILDQIGNDIAALFNTKYLGKVPNDAPGRMSLWNDVVKYHRELEKLRAIENFDPDRLTVEKGDTKKAVVVTDYVTPVNAMAQLYMTVVVE